MTTPAQPTRLVFGDQLQPGMVMVETCVGTYCYPKDLTHEVGRTHLLQVLDIRLDDKHIHTIVLGEDGEQHSWSSRVTGAARILVTIPDAATAEVTP